MTMTQYEQELLKIALSELERIGFQAPSAKDIKDMKSHFEKMPFVQAIKKKIIH